MILDDDVAEPEQFFHFTVTLKLKNSDNSIVINGSNEGRVAIRETRMSFDYYEPSNMDTIEK